MSRVHAFTDDALGDLDAVGIADTLRSGERSVPDLVDAAIARAESVDPQLAAIVHRDYARARRRSLAPSGGFFAGVPTFIKDNIDVAGLPTQFGTDAFVGTVRPKDSPFARLLHSAGFLPLGKTQLSEFGLSASAEHPRLDAVRNPWDPARTAGASSAGSAALVAAGVVPVAHANDGGGSIRIPAAATGLVGLKPSRGRLPIDPAAARRSRGAVRRDREGRAAHALRLDFGRGGGREHPGADLLPEPGLSRIRRDRGASVDALRSRLM